MAELVDRLRDHGSDAAGAQVRPVVTSGVGLVTEQDLGVVWPAWSEPRHPHRSEQVRQGGGVAGLTGCADEHQRSSADVDQGVRLGLPSAPGPADALIARFVHPDLRLVVLRQRFLCATSASTPTSGGRDVLVHPGHSRIHRHLQVRLAGGVSPQAGQQLVAGCVAGDACVSRPRRLPRARTPRRVPPGDVGPVAETIPPTTWRWSRNGRPTHPSQDGSKGSVRAQPAPRTCPASLVQRARQPVARPAGLLGSVQPHPVADLARPRWLRLAPLSSLTSARRPLTSPDVPQSRWRRPSRPHERRPAMKRPC